jgi:hypothetical protein
MVHKGRKVKKEIKVTRVMWDRKEFREKKEIRVIQDPRDRPEPMVLTVSMVHKGRKVKKEIKETRVM